MIPVHIYKKIPEVLPIENETPSNKTTISDNMTIVKIENVIGIDFLVDNKEFDEILAVNEVKEGNVAFKNFLDKSLNNIKFELTGNLKEIVRLNMTSMTSLKANTTAKQYVWINENKNAKEGEYKGKILLTTKEGYNSTFVMKIVHASPGFGVALNEKQTTDFLTKSKLNLLLGTIDNMDEPNVHPVWYLYENGKLYVETEKNAKKIKNLRKKRQPTFVLMMKRCHTGESGERVM